MIPELLSVLAAFTGGCLLVRAAGLSGWPVPAFGLVAGVSLQLAVGLVQVATPLPTTPVLTLALTCGLPAGWWLVRWRQGHDVSFRLPYALAVLAVLAPAVALLRAANLARWSTDSLSYLLAVPLLGDGTYASVISTHHLTKRLLGVPLLHAPAALAGESYLRSICPLLAVATVAIVVWFVRRGLPDQLSPTAAAALAVLAGLLLVTNNRVVFNAFYLNGHLLTAALVLVVAGTGWLLATRTTGAAGEPLPPGQHGAAGAPDRALMVLQVIAIPALVVTRPEGSLLAGIALLPTLLSGRVPVRHRSGALATLGATTALWHGFMLWVHEQRGAEVPLTVSAPLVLGVLLVAGVLLLPLASRLGRRVARPLWVAEAAAYAALAVLAARDPQILVDSVAATSQNLVFGYGSWGASLVVLGGLVVGAILVDRDRALVFLRFPVTVFVPVGFVLAYLREEGAYRVGFGDSFSRMFMHILPLAVVYVVTAYSALVRPPLPAEPSLASQPDPPRPGPPLAAPPRRQP